MLHRSGITWLFVIAVMGLITAFDHASAQVSDLIAVTGEERQQEWQPPKLTDLPLNWWETFESAEQERLDSLASVFVQSMTEETAGLTGENLLVGQRYLAGIKSEFELLSLAMQDLQLVEFESVPLRETYSLEDLLALNAQLRQSRGNLDVPSMRIDELESEVSLVEQQQDTLLRQYRAADPNSPKRLLLGLQRVLSRVELALDSRHLESLRQQVEQYREHAELLRARVSFAVEHLVPGDENWQNLEAMAVEARKQGASLSDKRTTLQHQLLDSLSAEQPKPSLMLLRKQQLTRTSVEQALSVFEEALLTSRANWYRFQSGALDYRFDINQSVAEARDMVDATAKQVEVWLAASHATAVSTARGENLNAVKNVELAHEAALETLALIKKIQSAGDDLLLVQEVLARDMVEPQEGVKSLLTWLGLKTGEARGAVQRMFEVNLFHIGEVPVTLLAIFMMFVILIFGFALSWLLRHLLDRLKKRDRFAHSPGLYTLGRILHYTIILIAVLAALGSIGLDFTNFALIAGALSVGIGFGLQSIVNNFVSGLILLFEGSLRVGDYIELDSGLRGTVKEINTRATVIKSNDSVDVVVPNSEFVTTQLTNWTLREPVARIRIDFGVAYGSDKEQVRSAALEAAQKVDFILHNMPRYEPQVRLVNFGESSLDFQMLAWVSKAGVRRPERVHADFLWELESCLGARGIQIPFPQRDLHLKSGFERVSAPPTAGTSVNPGPSATE